MSNTTTIESIRKARRMGQIRQNHVNYLASREERMANGAVRRAVLAAAEAEHAAYPQYAGHWSGPEWMLVRVKRDMRTKMGQAFMAKDVTLGRRGGVGQWTLYSLRNGVDTGISYGVEVI